MKELGNTSETQEWQSSQETSNSVTRSPRKRNRCENGKENAVSLKRRKIKNATDVPEKNQKTISAAALKQTLHGTIYQLKLLMLFLERGLKLNYIFKLESELPEAGKFDDLVFAYKPDGEEKVKYRFLQAKHKQNEEKNSINAGDLLSRDTSKPFSLQKYFNSYRNILENFKFIDASVELQDIMIYTNSKFDIKNLESKGISTLKQTGVNDPLLKMSAVDRETELYKLKVGSKHPLFEILKETYDANLLARELAEFTFNSKMLTLNPPIFRNYHAALVKNVIDINNLKFKDGFINNDASLDSPTKFFREHFVKKIIKLHKRSKKKEIWEDEVSYLKEIKFKISKSSKFGKNNTEQSLPTDIVTDDEIVEFLDKLVFAVNQLNEIELGKIIEKDLGIQLNLLNSELAYGAYQTKILDWLKEFTNRPLSENDAGKILEGIKIQLNALSFIENSRQHCESIQKYGLSFKEEFVELNIFLNGSEGKQIFHIVTRETTLLSSVKVCNAVKKLYEEDDSILFVSLMNLSYQETQDRLLNAFGANGSHELLVIENDFEDSTWDVQELCLKLLKIISDNSSKKLIIITISERNFGKIFSSCTNYEKMEHCCRLADFADDSRKKILKSEVRFQGELMELNKLLNEDCDDENDKLTLIDAMTLVKLVKKEVITIGGPAVQPFALGPEYIKLNQDISLSKLKEELSSEDISEDAPLFMISGVGHSHIDAGKDEFIRLLNDKIDISDNQKGDISSVDENKRRIFLSRDGSNESNIGNFVELCNKSPNKVIYLIEVTQHSRQNFWKLLYVYNSKSFLKRQLHRETIIDNSIINVLADEKPNDLFLFSNNHSEVEFCELFNINENTFENDKSNVLDTSDDDEDYKDIKQRLLENVKNKYIIWCSSENAEDNFNKLILKGKPVHWIHVEDKKLLWKRSHGTLCSLHRYKSKNVCNSFLDQDSFIGNLKEKVVIIADKPGQGKTTILNKLAKQRQASNWVIFIDLKNCYDVISELPDTDELSIDVVLNFIFKANKDCFNISISKNLLKYFLLNKSSYPPIILFDAFDEIRGCSPEDTSSKCQEKVLKLLKFIKEETTAALYVTTRLEKEQDLENELLVFATKLKEFEDLEQLEYLKNFWLVNLRLTSTASRNDYDIKFVSYANGLINNKLLMKHKNFMGIALQLRMVAEAFWQDFKKFVESESPAIRSSEILGDISALYHKFIDWKYDIFLKEKLEIMPKCPPEELGTLKTDYDKKHSKLAAYEILPTESFKSFFPNDFEYELSQEAYESEKDLLVLRIRPIGLISGSEFIHRTFAEFFCSYLLCNNLSKKRSNPTKYQYSKTFLLANIFKTKNGVIFNFMDQRLNANDEWTFIKESNLLFDSKKVKSRLEYGSPKLQTSNESLLDLQKSVEQGINWSWDKKHFYYDGDMDASLIENLYGKFFTVTNVDELKTTLDFLLNAHGKSFYRKANYAISSSFIAAALHFFVCYLKQNQNFGDISFKKYLGSLWEICGFDFNTNNLNDFLLKLDTFFETKNGLSWVERLRWLERIGVIISYRLKVLTSLMAQIFSSIINEYGVSGWEPIYASKIFERLILPLLTAIHSEEEMPHVDKLSLIDMFHRFADFLSKDSRCSLQSINKNQLVALLDCVKHVLKNNELTKEVLSTASDCLIRLKLWNINLIDYDEQTFLIQDSVGDFSYKFTMNNKGKIVDQIRCNVAYSHY